VENAAGYVMLGKMIRQFASIILQVSLLAAVAQAAEGDSAYTSLRAAQKVAGESATLLEMTGNRGEPGPADWKIVFSDPSARGGIREVTASGHEIISQRTPLRGYTDVGTQQPIALNRLNLDSGGAFDVANKQAVAKQLPFNWIDYSLRANNVTGAPMWVLRLFNNLGAQVGVLQVSAEDGSIIMPLEVVSQPRSSAPPEGTAERKIGGVIGTVGNAAERLGNTVKDSTLRAVGTVQEVLTGDRTIGPKDEE
jgi:hypothetical protein